MRCAVDPLRMNDTIGARTLMLATSGFESLEQTSPPQSAGSHFPRDWTSWTMSLNGSSMWSAPVASALMPEKGTASMSVPAAL